MTTVILQHFVSGEAFFTGCLCLLWGAVVAKPLPGRRRWVAWSIGLGTVLIALSSTPLPVAAYVAWGLLGIWVLATVSPHPQQLIESDGPTSQKPNQQFRCAATANAFFVVTLSFAAWEARYHLAPSPPSVRPQRLIVVGDSISAGIGEGEGATWPRLLMDRPSVDVVDLSRMGATVSSSLKTVEANKLPDGLVLLEIGGNDLLGGTSVVEFASALEALIQKLSSAHEVWMFELPLPPGFQRFGQVQRRLAARYSIRLIPKSVLSRLILSSESTLDSIHLTKQGHERFADRVEFLLDLN
ncbi:MAG: hypothetical protein KDA90_16350 [Planctomycetaceae bacterium]|nr:hypothetical protein [Planctomycetaceae bacterium]